MTSRDGVLPRPPRLVRASIPTRRRPPLGDPAPAARSVEPRTYRRSSRPPSLFDGHAQHPLVGVRGPADELRRRRRRTPPTSASCCFIEFGLVYANDWFVVPLTLPVGSVADGARASPSRTCSASGPGSRRPAQRHRDDWQRWSDVPASTSRSRPRARRHGLLLLPTVPKVQEGDAARGGRAGPRRDGEHGLGDRADGPAAQRRRPARRRGRAARPVPTSRSSFDRLGPAQPPPPPAAPHPLPA